MMPGIMACFGRALPFRLSESGQERAFDALEMV
jgi:hypothetical protein